MTTATARPLYEIAAEIRKDWKPVYFGAVPYLQAMAEMSSAREQFGMDEGRGIVLYFLSNAKTWKGEVARRVKAELKAMVR